MPNTKPRTWPLLPALYLALTASPTAAAPVQATERKVVVAPLSGAIFSPLDTLPAGVDAITYFQLNLLYGSSYSLHGAALGFGANGARTDALGLQLAGAANLAGRDAYGVQLSGFYNRAGGALRGLQLSLVNQTKDLDAGMQLGLANLAGASYGLQYGLVNIAGDLSGAQIATVNLARDVNGAQIGLVDTAGEVNGAQIGLVDTAGEVNGTQIGLVNIAGDVTGAQIGLVNVSSRNGYGQFGFINVDSSNWFRLHTSYGTERRRAIGIKSGSHWFFADIGLDLHRAVAAGKDDQLSFVGGLGLWHQLHGMSLALQFNRESFNQSARPYTLPFTCAFSMGGPVEGFGTIGPAFDRHFRYRQHDWSIGVQVQLRQQRPAS